jgi:hypothetical protein
MHHSPQFVAFFVYGLLEVQDDSISCLLHRPRPRKTAPSSRESTRCASSTGKVVSSSVTTILVVGDAARKEDESSSRDEQQSRSPKLLSRPPRNEEERFCLAAILMLAIAIRRRRASVKSNENTPILATKRRQPNRRNRPNLGGGVCARKRALLLSLLPISPKNNEEGSMRTGQYGCGDFWLIFGGTVCCDSIPGRQAMMVRNAKIQNGLVLGRLRIGFSSARHSLSTCSRQRSSLLFKIYVRAAFQYPPFSNGLQEHSYHVITDEEARATNTLHQNRKKNIKSIAPVVHGGLWE